MKDLNVFGKTMNVITLYHGSSQIVVHPDLILNRRTKDFGFGFYVTSSKSQAESWAIRKSGNHGNPIVSVFELDSLYVTNLNNKIFEDMTEEWLDFITLCRSDRNFKHGYDTIEGPMADDTIFNAVGDFVAGDISREAFWALCKFKHPTHQIVFSTERSLGFLNFRRYYSV